MRISDWSSDVCSSVLYPAPIPYVIAETIKGFGFPGADTNAAHNLPLGGNPAQDEPARNAFNEAAQALFVPAAQIESAVGEIAVHREQGREPESRHALALRNPAAPSLPEPDWTIAGDPPDCAMHALDRWFVRVVDANPTLRPPVGNSA